MQVDLTTLTDAELDDLRRAVSAEQMLRRKLDASPEKMDAVQREYQEAHGIGQGEAWQFPTTGLTVYREGAEVTHDGRRWISTHSGNAHAPGESGWRPMPEEDEEGNVIPPPYVQPAGAHDAYQAGERITFDGKVYQATRDGVVHTPAEHAASWELVEVEAEPEPDPEPGEPVEPEPEPTTPEWEVGKAYVADDEFTYQGAFYRVRQGHTSAAHWPPDQVQSLYEVI